MIKGNRRLTKENRIFLTALALFVVVMIYRYFSRHMTEFNTTLYAFHYGYGFISRALLGSLWALIDWISPSDLMNYLSIYRFNEIMTLVYIIAFFLFFRCCLRYGAKEDMRNMRYLIIFLSIFAFPIFLCRMNFGRIDIFLFMITLGSLILLIKERVEWLIIPLCILAECLHHGFVFMNVNIILVLLLYKAIMKQEKRERRKYFVLFGIVFLTVSAFFLYFEFFSHADGEHIYEEVVDTATRISDTGDHYSRELVNHEILGEGVFMDEWKYHVANYIDLPIFLLFFFPYLLIAYHFFRNLLNRKMIKEKFAYGMVLLGPCTILPEMILKVDYGRYVYAVFFYYITIIMCLIVMGDRTVAIQLEATKQEVKKRVPCAIFFLVYPMAFMPLYDTAITMVDDLLRVWLFGGQQLVIY